MHLYAILTFNKDYQLHDSHYNLNEFFFIFRSKIQTEIERIATDLIKKTEPNISYIINDTINETEIIIYGSTLLTNYVVITSKSYPASTAKQLMYVIRTGLEPIDILFKKYQNPYNVDKIAHIKSELDETKIIILNSIDKLIERGGNLDDLVEKAEQLEISSMKFRDNATDMNSCCIIS